MNFFIMVSLILSVLLGIFRGIDLALLTDAETGLCIVGSVWLRYGALAVAVLAADGKKRVGILATDGTVQTGIYQRECGPLQSAAGRRAAGPLHAFRRRGTGGSGLLW